MALRLGDLLVARGLITDDQRSEALAFQRLHGRPFGLLVEQMFGVAPNAVESAWAEQFAQFADRITADQIKPDPLILGRIDRRQAWQFGVIPLRLEDGELVIATAQDRLARAMRFVGWRIDTSCRFLLCPEDDLVRKLGEHYPMPGAEPAFAGRLRLG
jgi:hypothetical protein